MILFLANLLFSPLTVLAQAEEERQESPIPDDATGSPPRINPDKTWKVSSHQGWPAWSPQKSDLLAVSYHTSLMLLGANGTEIKRILETDSGIGVPKFSFDGDKIGFMYHINSTTKLFVYDLGNDSLSEVPAIRNITDFSWDINNNIIYGKRAGNADAPYQIVALDLQTGAESILMDSIRYLDGLDVRSDGKKIVIAMSVNPAPDCNRVYYATCNAQLAIHDIERSTTDEDNTPTKISQDSFKVITNTDNRKTSPKWSLDGSYIIYYGSGYRSGGTYVVASDGTVNNFSSLLTTEGKQLSDGISYRGISENKDGTMVAYSIGGSVTDLATFNRVNSGLYIGHTPLCDNGSRNSDADNYKCPIPVKSIPLIEGPAVPFTILVPALDKSISGYVNSDYGKTENEELDVDSKKLSMLFQNFRNTDSRDIQLYFPSSVLSGNMTVFINGTQFYPSPVGDIDDCLSRWSKAYCTDIKAEIDGIEGWSIVRISDNTTNPRSALLVEIMGTSVIPEFSSYATVALVAVPFIGTIAVMRFAVWHRK